MGSATRDISLQLGHRYHIEQELGRGGMATVYMATDTTVGRHVAIKVLHPELAAAVGADRFHREINIASALTHPNILPVHDSGEFEGRLFYVMPVVEGESLRERLKRERQLSVDEAIRITCEVASALEYAHSRGVVHRDVKPENILLEAGHAVVADFGIARAASLVAEGPALTQTGMSLGTPAYMSPEQALGDKMLDGRSDQYALACVTYEMLTGEPPFSAPTAQALIAKHLTSPVPEITTVRPAVPDEVEDVIFRALEKVPADRHASIVEFAAALADADGLEGATSSRRLPGTRAHRAARTTRHLRAAREDRRERSRRRGMAFGIAALLAMGAGGAGLWLQHARTLDARGTTELKRIGVLYFQDLSADGHLGALADGLSEALIDRLRDVQTLDVVSRDGVAPFRKGRVALDSVARLLKVGTLVTGTVEPEGGGVRIALRLRDATGSDFDRMSFTVPQGALLSARDSVARATADMLRPVIGEEVQLREERHAAHDALAWSLVQRAERLRKDGEDRSAGDSVGAAAAFGTADSLLRVAQSRDATWSQPAVIGARIALRRAKLATSAPAITQWIDTGLADAQRALAIDPRNADALELRGALRYERFVRNLAATHDDEKELVRTAEADLLRATEINPAQANAWNILSALYYRKTPPDLAGANINARRALDADAYLAAADEVVWRLFATSYDLGQHDQAVRWCDDGHQRFPTQSRFVLCRLYIGFMREQEPDVAQAFHTADEVVALTPPARRPLVQRQARMLASVALAYSGQRDSARRVLLASRADKTIDPDGSLLTPEALVRVRLGDRAEAVRLLKLFLSEHPQHIAGMTRNTWWWKDLENDPEFKAMIGAPR